MIKTNIIYIIVILFLCSMCACIDSKNKDLASVLHFDDSRFNQIVANQEFKFQMMLTTIDKSTEKINFNTLSYNLDTTTYFYPASSVKLPTAILALQKLNEIKEQKKLSQLNRKTALLIDSTRVPQSKATIDSTTLSGRPNIENYIDKIFAISDNDAYNRLFEFLGSDYINSELKAKGCFNNSRIVHRVGASSFSAIDNRYTNAFEFVDKNANSIYKEKEKYSINNRYPKIKNSLQGRGFYQKDSLINVPFDFSTKNYVNLYDYDQIMRRIFYPEAFKQSEKFDLTNDQLSFFTESMGKTPRQHKHLNYDTVEYYDSYVKFLMFGDSKKPIPEHIKIHNKVGYAYGYLTDIAFIKDKKNDVEFILCATVHVNKNKIFNDNEYEYEALGIPFLAELGRRVYNYVLEMEGSRN